MGRPTRGELAVLLVAAALSFWNLWASDLWAPDEPYFGEGAREMMADGEWLVPHVNGEVTTDKPPLFFWLIALFSLPFGKVLSLTARLPSALAAFFSVALTIRLARRFRYGERTSLLAGLMLATMMLFARQARSAQIDALLTLLVLIAVSAFAAYRSGEADGRRAGLLFWTAAAAAVLAKGPVGLLLPLGVALITSAFDRPRVAWRGFAPILGPLVFLLLSGSWALWATYGSGGEYSAADALRRHFVDRAVYGMHHLQPPWYYLGQLPFGVLPWTGVVLGGLLLAWRCRRRPEERLLLIWALFVVAFFSVSTEKRDLYVLPALPALAILGARLAGSLAGWRDLRFEAAAPLPSARWVTLSQGATGAILLLAGVALPVIARRPVVGLDLRTPAWIVGVVLALGGAAMLLVSWRGRVAASVLATAATGAALYLTVATVLLPAFDPIKSVRGLAEQMRAETAGYRAGGGEILTLGLGNVPRALSFYSDGVYFDEMASADELARHLAVPGTHWLLTSAKQMAELPAATRSRCRQVDSSRMSKLEVVLVEIASAGGGPAPTRIQ